MNHEALKYLFFVWDFAIATVLYRFIFKKWPLQKKKDKWPKMK